jgi:Coenzyme PQQ synthesis protein D (PqqD)
MFTVPVTQLFIRSRSVVSRVVAGETLIVPIRGKVGDLASIYSFNGTGSLIWKLLDSPASSADLIQAVESEYEVSQDQASRDVVEFLNELSSVGLVDVCPSVPHGAADSHAQLLADVAAG